MKAYKPGDIYKTNPILRRATGQDKTNFDKFLEVAGTVKSSVENIFNNRIADNIQRLEEEKEFDKINAKAQLAHLSQFGNIQKDIETKYKNDVNAWARDYAREEVDDDFIRKQGMNMSPEDLNNVVKQPTAAYGDYLKNREEELVNAYNAILGDLDSLGVPYRDLDASKKFIDESYENIFNNMEDDNRFNLIGGIGSFLRGNGFNTTDYNELAKQYEKNAFQAKLSDIEDVNNKFKSLYAMSPALAAQFEKTVESIDYKVMGETKLDVQQLPDGAGIIVTNIQNYTDKNGNPQMVQKQEVITNPAQIEIINQKSKTFEAQQNYMEFLTPKGQEVFTNNLKDKEQTIHDAFLNVPPEHKIPYDEVIARATYEKNLGAIVGSYDDIMEQKFYEKDSLGRMVAIPVLQAYINGTGPKPAGYYDTPYEFAKSLIPNLNLGDFNRIVYPDTETTTTQPYSNSYQVEMETAADNDVVMVVDEVKQALFNGDDAKIADYQSSFEGGSSLKGVDKEGNYFGDGASTFSGTPEQVIAALPQLSDTILNNSALAQSKIVSVGYNIKDDRIVLKPGSAMMDVGEGEGTSEELTQFDKRRRILETRLEEAEFLNQDKKVSLLKNQLEELGIIEERAKARDEKLEFEKGGLMKDKAAGRNITDEAIEQVAMGDKAVETFLTEIANIESKFGRDNNTFKGASKGIFQIDPIAFEEVQRRLEETNEKDGATTRLYNEQLKQNLDLDLSQLSYQDLDKPLVGAAFARAYLLGFAEAIPETVLGRAKYWKKYYNTEAGKGTAEKYLKENTRL